ncbi:mechanosensitive ion channel family protein [Halalkalirubrum salinum]|uniref:mechanosensitive ion channel family protein n=1 Tax=Halalkalirubrum salinum TaxID=2563889 RepID=UPI0010FB8EE6|nr:mechanosensitive ion channel family protein [Halalkalirubrum salinum]
MLPMQQGISIDLQQFVPTILSAVTTTVIFLIVFLVVYRVGRSIMIRSVKNGLQRRNFDDTLIGFTVSMTVLVTAVFAVALAATVAGFGTVLAAFATLGGALTLAVGFAAQDLIANFVAGVFIVKDEPFTVGDWIEWDDNEGVVREIQMRVTKLDTFDNQLVTVPNSDLANAAIINNAANDRRRVSIDFQIGYDADINQARDVIIEEGTHIDGVLETPEPSAPVTELGDSAVILSGRLWIDPSESSYGVTTAEFTERVKQRFDAEGIDIPYPNTALSGGVTVANTAIREGATGD